jgi:leucyl aminopeptidase (aminopeptidase T)
METKDPSEMTTQELEQLLAQKKEKERKDRDKKRKEYEEHRDVVVETMVSKARDVSSILTAFKKELNEAFELQKERLEEYGAIRGNSKGGFSIQHTSGNFKAVRTRATSPKWDERSEKALVLISDFLRDTVKKKDQKIYDILKTFIQKNDKGELEYSKVMHLLSHKDKYDDPRWVEGLNLIQESYSIDLRGYGYEFYTKNEEGKWEKIEINFTAI